VRPDSVCGRRWRPSLEKASMSGATQRIPSKSASTHRRSWGLIYLITFGSLVGFVSYGWLIQNAPVSLTSTYAYVNPMVAVLLGWLFAGEELNARIAVSSVIIIGAVIMINLARNSKPAPKNEMAIPEEIE